MTKEYLNTLIQLVTAGFGLVSALAWNTLIQNLINQYSPKTSGIASQFIYAIVITFLAVWITTSLAALHDRIAKKEKKQKGK